MEAPSSSPAEGHRRFFPKTFLSPPLVRVVILVVLSVLLFLFVMLHLLPSAEVRVWPREDAIDRTANIFLASSGALAAVPPRARSLPLVPIAVRVQKVITFDQISKKFIGVAAEVPLTVWNRASEAYVLRQGTRFVNQAGVIFRIQASITVPPGEQRTVRALADDLDTFGEIIGERGNVPAGLRWEIPGLPVEERRLVYGENAAAGVGGTSVYHTVLRPEDIAAAQRLLEQELLTAAKQMVEEERAVWNAQHPQRWLEILHYPELTHVAFEDVLLPTNFLGEEVGSVPVEGVVSYRVLAYDAQALLDLLAQELSTHVRDGRSLVADTLQRERLTVHVVDYADDFSWVKLTVDLHGKERTVLDPFSPLGIRYGKEVREKIQGLSKEEALRFLRNMPEVQKVELSLWPPWSMQVTTIPSHIAIVEREE